MREELKKTEDERRELRQKLLEEANKRKALKAQITAREIEEKRLLEAKRERNRLEIKLKEEKLRKLDETAREWPKKKSGPRFGDNFL